MTASDWRKITRQLRVKPAVLKKFLKHNKPKARTMGVAAFIVHGADPIGMKEKALLFLFGFLAIALLGAGKHSVDRK